VQTLQYKAQGHKGHQAKRSRDRATDRRVKREEEIIRKQAARAKKTASLAKLQEQLAAITVISSAEHVDRS
jgi:hypothetical protein